MATTKSAPARPRRRASRRRRKQARKALLGLLAELRRGCGAVGTASDWYMLVEPVGGLLKEYEDVLDEAERERLEDATKLAEATRSGVERACRGLRLEVEKTIEQLPVYDLVQTLLIGGFIVVAVAVGAKVAADRLRQQVVPVVISNVGCDPIALASPGLALPPGLELPSAPIPRGGQATARVPRLPIEVDATAGAAVTVRLAGATARLVAPARLSSAELDGRPLLGRKTTLDLSGDGPHRLVLTCG